MEYVIPAGNLNLALVILGVAVLGGIIGLDRTAVGQFMISQPVVAGSLTGWLLGDAPAGLVIGAILELIWVLDLPIGTFVPADATIVTVSTTAVATIGQGQGESVAVIGCSLLLSMVMVPMTMRADAAARNWIGRISSAIIAVDDKDLSRSITQAHGMGLLIFFLKSFVLIGIFVPAGMLAMSMFSKLPAEFFLAMSLFGRMLPFLGVALVVRRLTIKVVDPFYLGGFLAAVLCGNVLSLPVIATVLMTAITGWMMVKYYEQRT